jgi:hypothetical protein
MTIVIGGITPEGTPEKSSRCKATADRHYASAGFG